MKFKLCGSVLLTCAIAAFSQVIVVVSPNGGENYAPDQKVNIQWSADASISNVAIELSLDNGVSWSTILYGYSPGSGARPWIVPYLKHGSTHALIRVTANNMNNPPSDVSDGVFTIQAAAPDAYEPNNDTAHAYSIALGDSVVKNALVMGDSMMSDTATNDIDFFRVNLAAGKLVTVTAFYWSPGDSGNDTGSGSGSVPFVGLYNSSGTMVAGNSSVLTYNVTQAGTYYIKVSSYFSAGSWCKYGLSIKEITTLAKQTSKFDSSSVHKVTDSTYTLQISADTTNLTINLTLGSKTGGTLNTATLPANELLNSPSNEKKIKAILLVADSALSRSLKAADIIIPYNEADLNSMPETSLIVMWLNDSISQWSPISFTIDTIDNVITARITHFSIYCLFSKKPVTEVTAPVPQKKAFSMTGRFIRGEHGIAVNFTLPFPARTEMSLYNAKGICVKRQILPIKNTEGSEVLIDCSDLGTGVYILSFHAGRYCVNRVMTLIK